MVPFPCSCCSKRLLYCRGMYELGLRHNCQRYFTSKMAKINIKYPSINKLNPNLSSNELTWLFSEILPPNQQKCKTRLKQSKQDKLFSLPWNRIGIQPRSPKYCQNWAHLTIPHQLRQLVALNSCGNKLANRSPQ